MRLSTPAKNTDTSETTSPWKFDLLNSKLPRQTSKGSSKHIWSLQTLVELIGARPERQDTDFSTSVNMESSRFEYLSVLMSLGFIFVSSFLGETETKIK